MTTPQHLTILTGASRGMGLALAEQLLTPNALLLCVSRQPQPALDALAARQGATLLQWAADLKEAAPVAQRLGQWLAALPANQREHLQSATLINNAGVISALVPLRESQALEVAQALRVGLEAPMLLSAAFLQATRGWTGVHRKVLNISSGLGRRAMASSAAYCAAKAGMDHFTRCLALEEALLPQGARVCSLAPGVIDTAMQEQLRSADALSFSDQGNFAQLHSQGQLSSPSEAAQRVLAYLARSDFGQQPVADVRQ